MVTVNKIGMVLLTIAYAGAAFANTSTTSNDKVVIAQATVATPAEPAPAPAAVTAPAPAPAAAPAAPAAAAAAAVKVTYASDTYFSSGFFSKSRISADEKMKLDNLVDKVSAISLEVIVVVGHTDSTGNDEASQTLSESRAEAVKEYLISKGIEKNRIYTEGKGSKQAIADNNTEEGRDKNNRVEVEVVGTRKN